MASVNFRVLRDTQGVSKFLRPAQVRKVGRTVANYGMRELKRTVGGAIPRRTFTGVLGFRRHRVKGTTVKARSKNRAAILWLGGNRIAAPYLGAMRTTSDGARAGKHHFKGSFIATMKNGYTSIFHRNAEGTLVQDTADVVGLRDTAMSHASKIRSPLQKLLQVELLKEFNKK